jgi:ribosome biogenesis GTPase
VGDDLKAWGWDAAWDAAFAPYRGEGTVPARVAKEFNHIFRVWSEEGDLLAQQAGRMKHRAGGRQDLAAVGDWVAVRRAPGHAEGTIEAILPRRSKFSRKVAGDTMEEQVVAANIDTVLIVMGLDGDYNPRRLERYLVLAHDSGAQAVVLLNKADIASDVDAALAEITAIAADRPVHAISARAGEGLEHVLAYLGPGRTGALLGSSGVGKSTIINAVVGEARLATHEVRARDSRGRHTTRHRELIPVPGHGLLIDTPGMRELQLWDVSEAIAEAFDDIDALAVDCHFTDCRHRDEPRCAVKAAVADGRLAASRLASYLKLQDERELLDARRDERALIEEKRRGKIGSKALKQLYRQRGR